MSFGETEELSTLQSGSEVLSGGIFIEILDSEHVKISCNYCSKDDYIFFEGDNTNTPETDWIGKAVIHLYNHHPGTGLE